jgi:uncharacterized protein YciI
MYVLVVLKAGERVGDEPLHTAEHERFIDWLIERNLVLLGGGFAQPIGDSAAGYVLRCESVDAARRLAESDPYVVHRVLQAELAEWALVGINPEAIDASSVVRPGDV